ncbi:MAG: ABC transporter permease [Vulcanibacillus sp.]
MILKAMIKKEFMEMFRNYMIITIPILFMLLGAMQPITYYYLPDILKMATLSEGAIIQIPVPTPSETIYSIYSQFNQVGLLILVLISMGAVVNEVKNGVAETILVKPITINSYLLSKWIAYFTLTIFSTFLGVLIGKYYTTLLIGSISWTIIIKSTAIFILYLLFFISFNLLLSSILNSGIVAGGITILTAIIFGIISSLTIKFWFLPSYLLIINKNNLFDLPSNNFWLSISITIIYIVSMFFLSAKIFSQKESIT